MAKNLHNVNHLKVYQPKINKIEIILSFKRFARS